MSNGNGNGDKYNELTLAASSLAATVDRLNKDVGEQMVEQARMTKINRVMIWIVTVVTVIAVAGIIMNRISAENVKENTHKINEISEVSRQEALCPLWDLFLAAESPRGGAVYPQGPEAYDKAFDIIRHGYDVLECNSFKVSGGG